MKIQILSDLHIEFESCKWTDVGADLVILAGDTHLGALGVMWAQETIRDRPVIYVMGNHEYYGKAYPRLTRQLKERTVGSNVQVVENRGVVLEDIAFLGCTLWTDFALGGDREQACEDAIIRMADYRRIKSSPVMRPLSPVDTIAVHDASLAWLRKASRETGDRKLVVITHHAPSARSLIVDGDRDMLAPAYASNLEQEIKEIGADLWVHGHIHRRSDYRIGKTRVVANPRGYPRLRVDDFDPGFCVEL